MSSSDPGPSDRPTADSAKVLYFLLGAIAVAVASWAVSHVASLPPTESIPIGVIVGLVFFSFSLWFSRQSLSARLASADRSGAESLRKIADLQRELEVCRPAALELKNLQSEYSALRVDHEAAKAKNTQVESDYARLVQRTTAVEGQNATLNEQVRRLEVELRAERESTARAPFMPEIDLTFQLVGVGFLGWRGKNVNATFVNVGKGNALRVQVATRIYTAGQTTAWKDTDFLQVMKPSQQRTLSLGSVDAFDRVEVQIKYESTFSPRDPVQLCFTVPKPEPGLQKN